MSYIEQLILSDVGPRTEFGDTHVDKRWAEYDSLARRVIAAEKLVDAMQEAETVSVHCGYDQGCGGGNFVYKDAILVEDIQPALATYEATK